MPKIKDVTNYLESIAPLALQESYDNSGLLTGDASSEVTGILISLDCTEEVVEEALAKKCNLIVSHHPIVFKGLKKLTGSNYVERTVIKAIKNDIALYAIHTNLDNIKDGVNRRILDILGLKFESILKKKTNLSKIVTFVPPSEVSKVTSAMHTAGAGNIGNYEDCSFQIGGVGTFRPNDTAIPHIGKTGENEKVDEIRVEMILPGSNVQAVVQALNDAHPYEEVAYYLSELANSNQDHGAGMLGSLETALEPVEFLELLKQKMNLKVIKHTHLPSKKVKNIAVCGGSGSFLISAAIHAKADVFISSDIKYHEFFDAENRLLIADIGHYESEVFTKDLLGDILNEKFTTFAVNLSETVTNPISYF